MSPEPETGNIERVGPEFRGISNALWADVVVRGRFTRSLSRLCVSSMQEGVEDDAGNCRLRFAESSSGTGLFLEADATSESFGKMDVSSISKVGPGLGDALFTRDETIDAEFEFKGSTRSMGGFGS